MSWSNHGQTASRRHVRIAELQIDPAQLEAFSAATRDIGQASVNLEDGRIALYAVADKDNPAFVRVFEIYRDPAPAKRICKRRTSRRFATPRARW